MAKLMRFGRRIALPSTRQIRHELVEMILEDNRKKAMAVAEHDPASAAPAADLTTSAT